jgi:hypothetical protein
MSDPVRPKENLIFSYIAIILISFSLDFVFFSTTQPTAGTSTDTFTVGGSTSSVMPIICGDNARKHSMSKNEINKEKEYF